jgi:flagellar basal body-associated protein FliL
MNGDVLPKRSKGTKSRIRRIPLITGIVFVAIGFACLALVFSSPESTKATYALMVVTFMGFGVEYLNKSGVFEI